MTATPETLGVGYFDGMYAAAADPWGFEILYYFGDHDLTQVLKHAVDSLKPDGTLLAVHWRHPVAEYPRTGDDVHQVLAAQPGLGRLAIQAEPDFLAEVYIRTEGTPRSVAQATGLV